MENSISVEYEEWLEDYVRILGLQSSCLKCGCSLTICSEISHRGVNLEGVMVCGRCKTIYPFQGQKDLQNIFENRELYDEFVRNEASFQSL